MSRTRQGPLPARYRRKKGHTNYDLAQKRVREMLGQGEPPNTHEITGLPMPEEPKDVRVDWCTPLDPAFVVRRNQ